MLFGMYLSVRIVGWSYYKCLFLKEYRDPNYFLETCTVLTADKFCHVSLSDFCFSSWPWTCLAWKNRICERKRCCHLPLLNCPGGNSTTLHSYKNCVHTNTKELCVKCKKVKFTK